jgi:endonuclease YncB( thermonuclease family)
VKRFLLLSAAVLALAASSLAQTFTGKVVGVSDGDTLTVLTEGNKPVKVRIFGIDAPESSQPFGTKSKQFASDMAFGKSVTVEKTGEDRYGRTLGVVRVGDKSVGLESVRSGLAWWYRQYAPSSMKIKAAEAEARLAKRGIWSEPNPTAPWEYRRGGKSARRGASSSGYSAPRRRTSPPAVVSAASRTVYTTATGSKYHADGCRYLSRSQYRTTLKQAQAEGYDACSVCGGG